MVDMLGKEKNKTKSLKKEVIQKDDLSMEIIDGLKELQDKVDISDK